MPQKLQRCEGINALARWIRSVKSRGNFLYVSFTAIILDVQIRVKSYTKKQLAKNTPKLADMVVKSVKLRYNHTY